MLRLVVLFFLTCFSLLLPAQDYINEWVQRDLATDSFDIYYQDGSTTIVSTLFDVQGNRYMLTNYTGQYTVFNGDTFHYPGTANGNFMGNGGAVLRKIDPQGNVLWSKGMAVAAVGYQHTTQDLPDLYGQKLAWHTDSSIIMVASSVRQGEVWFNDSVSVSPTYFTVDSSRTGFFMLNLNQSGGLNWFDRFSYHYGGYSSIEYELAALSLLQVDEVGNIYMAGKIPYWIAAGDSTFYSVCQTNTYLNGTAPFAMKLNAQGQHLWGNTVHFSNDSIWGWYAQKKLDNHRYDMQATMDDSNNVYLSFVSGFYSDVYISIDDDTLIYDEPGKNFFLTKLNGQTGNNEWFKSYVCEASNTSFGDSKQGPLFFLNDTLYNMISPQWGALAKVVIDSGDTLLDPDPLGAYGYLVKHTIDGQVVGIDSFLAPTDDVNSVTSYFMESVVYEDEAYLAVYNANILNLNGTSFNAFASSSSPTLILKYNPLLAQYSLFKTIITNSSSNSNPGLSLRHMHFEPNGDFYISGYTFLGADFGEIEVSWEKLWDGFLAKYRNCQFITQGLTGDSTICTGESTTLYAPQFDSVTYAWSQNGYILNNQNDTSLITQQGGVYRVIVTDSIGCEAQSDPYTVYAQGASSVTLNLTDTSACANDTAHPLSGGSPMGGVYFGSGVTGNSLNPSVIPIGNNTVYYTAQDSIGCVDTVSDVVFVEPEPTVFFAQSVNVCSSDTVSLTGGVPSGGAYSGLGVVGNQFYTQTAGAGVHQLVYSYTSSGGCASSDTIGAVVNQTPSVNFNWSVDSTCENGSIIAFDGFSPAGGSFSGTGVSGNYFIPGIVAPDQYSISYSIDSNGCTGVAKDTIQVDSFPAAVLSPLDSICVSATSYPLTHGYPAGGMFSGTGIVNNVFDASVAGIGTHAISYVFENSCAADTAYSTITVIASPILSATSVSVSCFDLSDGQLSASASGGNAPHSYAWSTADSTAAISSLAAGSYTVSVSGDGGCVASSTFSVSQPDVLALSIDSLQDVNCNGFNDGAIYVSTDGGTTAYAYSWSTGASTEDVTSLSSGVFAVTVTDANGCTDTLSATVNETDPIVQSLTATDISCFGSNDGQAATVASGGGGTYSYAWSSGATTANASLLPSGVFYVTVSDQNSCESIDSVEIEEPDSLVLSVSGTNLSCYLSANGVAQASVSGGRTPYAYAWSNGATVDSITSLTAGAYALTVTDSSGCMTNAGITITEPDSLSIQTTLVDSILCQGGSDASLTATAVGGTLPYGYTWNTGSTADSIGGLTAGTYSITVTDTNGCVHAKSTVISEPALLTLTFDSLNHLSCFESADGSIYASSSGGIGAMSYNWNNGGTAASLTALTAGSYTVTVTDANGCTTNQSANINQPDEINVTTTVTHVLCYGDSSGSASTMVSNAQGSVSYLWSTGNTMATDTGLMAGAYQVTVTDSAGCGQIDSVVITEPNLLTVVTVAVDSNSCFGDSTGSIEVSPAGGTEAYTYVWSNGETTELNDSIPAGLYGVTVTDSAGCEVDSSISVYQPNELMIDIDSLSTLSCYADSNGYVVVSAIGGSGLPLFVWSDAGVGSIRNNLTAGSYTVTVADANGCEADTSLMITQPVQLVAQVDSFVNLLCYNDSSGAVFASASGGSGTLGYAWNIGQTVQSITNLQAGQYDLTVTDSLGCEFFVSQTVSQPDSIQLSDSIGMASCDNVDDGFVIVNATGGTLPHSFMWNTADTTTVLSGIGSGLYQLTLTDANGCWKGGTWNVGYVHTAPNAELGQDTGICNGETLVLSPAGVADTYVWSTTDTTVSITVAQTDTYWLYMLDTTGCSDSDTIDISVFALPEFDLGKDTMMCIDSVYDGYDLVGPVGMSDYLWSTSGTGVVETVSDTGLYWLQVTDSNGCSWTDTVAVLKGICAGLETLAQDFGITVYPNPNRGVFTLESGTSDAFALKVFNTQGKVVREAVLQHRIHLDLRSEGAGVYFITGAGHAQTWTLRVIVL